MRATTQLSLSRCWRDTNLLFMAVYSAVASLLCSHTAEFESIRGVAGLNLEERCLQQKMLTSFVPFLYQIFTLCLNFSEPSLKLNLFRSFRLLKALFLLSKLSLSSPRLLFHLLSFPPSFLLFLALLPSHVASSSPVPSISTFPHKAVFHRSPCSLE